jgi:DNA-binding NtrC family response regulator
MTMGKPSVLVVDDKEPMLALLASILSRYEVAVVSDAPRVALALLDRRGFEVVLTDVRMPEVDGHEVLETVKTVSPDTEVIMMTGYATVPDAVLAMRRGAFDYLEKPFDPDDLLLAVGRALEHRHRRLSTRTESVRVPEPEAATAVISVPYREAVEAIRESATRTYLAALMREFDGNVTSAAERARMERESLHRLLRRYGIRPEDFRRAARAAGRSTRHLAAGESGG